VWLLIFSAHHAAPDAPIWMGGTQVHQHHSLERAGTALSFSAAHDHDRHGHCELCFSGSFQLPVGFVAPPRHMDGQSANWHEAIGLEFANDIGLPDAHAPPLI
jgi:hypothetical protein